MKRVIEWIERSFRLAVVYPVLRLVFRNPVSNDKIDLSSIDRLLIFRYDRIGDMIITTPILKALKKRNPRLEVAILASQSNSEILRGNSSVDKVYVLQQNWMGVVKMVLQLRRQHFDVVLNLVFNRTTGPGILANVVAPGGYKVGQGPDRYAFYFNRLLKLPRFEKHMIESLAFYVREVFGITLEEDELQFEIQVGDDATRVVDRFLERNLMYRRSSRLPNRLPYVVFNLSAGDAERSVSIEQAMALSRHLSENSGFRTVLIHPPVAREMQEALVNEEAFSACLVYRTEEPNPLNQIASLIGGALLVITPDTSFVHFASAMSTPVFGIYTSMPGMEEWMPYRVQHTILKAPAGKPASEIQSAILLQKVDEFISSVLAAGRHQKLGAI
jgi:ADP-heptose:LPS heptosyltransferase